MRLRKSVLAIILCVAGSAEGHDLFLKLESYFLSPNSKVVVRLLNGTFQMSDGLVARTRMRDISLVSPYSSKSLEQGVVWRDEGKTTVMELQTEGPWHLCGGDFYLSERTQPEGP